MSMKAGSLQAALRMVVTRLLTDEAIVCRPRDMETRELLGQSLEIVDPRNRLVRRPHGRPWSLPFAMAEFLWYMRADNRVEALRPYAPAIVRFSDDGVTLNSAYGRRIFGVPGSTGQNQWQYVKDLLRRDPDSRQAVMHIRTANDSLLESKDHPCTLTLQFLQRAGKLSLIVNMRSNDVMVGSAYDMFSFTLMQEAMAVELGCELGSYYHQVGSWHLYSRDLVLATEFARGTADLEPMPRMEAGLGAMIADEEGLRKGEYVPPGDGYWRDWRLVLGAFFGGSPVSRFASCYSEVWQPGGTAAGGSRGEP